MNIHSLAAQLSFAGHHDLVEELLTVHLNEEVPQVRLGSHIQDTEGLERLLGLSASRWLAAACAAHSVDDRTVSNEMLDLANEELRNIVDLNDKVRIYGTAPVVQINPVATTPESNIEDSVELVLSRMQEREDYEELEDRLLTAKTKAQKRDAIMQQWKSLKLRNRSLPTPKKPGYDPRFHQKFSRWLRTKQFNVIEKEKAPKDKLLIFIEVPNINKAKMESNRLNKYVPLLKKDRKGKHLHRLPEGMITISVRSSILR